MDEVVPIRKSMAPSKRSAGMLWTPAAVELLVSLKIAGHRYTDIAAKLNEAVGTTVFNYHTVYNKLYWMK